MGNLSEKSIIITGATSGIGLSLARGLAKLNTNLILVSRSEEKLKQLQTDLKQISNGQVQIYVADLMNRTECHSVFNKIIEHNQKIDGLINNAGIGVFESADLINHEDIDQMVQLNLLSVIETTQLLIPIFKKQQFGHLINIASFAGKMATPKSAVYSATKSGVIAYTNAVRLEIETNNIFVTSVNLGPVKTSFFNRADPTGQYQKAVSAYMLDPDYVANKIIKYLFKRKREINLPWWMSLGSKIHYLFPTIVEQLLRKQFSKK
ncbi:SDR family NAD(P)-dependent oxidoreductase [Amphibacillus sp. MSJ-3]|uniref:SDR family NAD(P)-dependent oxidoreductase n=1 Tax=Amphibacillus sp. MSJ-3 TaxID=2841505 RepID=UPI00353041D0